LPHIESQGKIIKKKIRKGFPFLASKFYFTCFTCKEWEHYKCFFFLHLLCLIWKAGENDKGFLSCTKFPFTSFLSTHERQWKNNKSVWLKYAYDTVLWILYGSTLIFNHFISFSIRSYYNKLFWSQINIPPLLLFSGKSRTVSPSLLIKHKDL
jgi:hypothetical protein